MERVTPEQNRYETSAESFTDSPQAGNGNEKNVNTEGASLKRTANRGFAAMDREKQKRIASEGGRAAHKQGVAHEWNRDEAREAGKKGGERVSRNREHMSEIGRKGGQNSGLSRQRGGE